MSDVDESKASRPNPAAEARGASSGTRPGSGLAFADLFDVEEIQAIQDAFSAATGVGSIITKPDGAPITRPSNFCRLCGDIIRGTDKGLANCRVSDAVIGRPNPSGPVIQPCLSGGLWDAGASISAGGEHVANWLIGQVRNEIQDETAMLAYADEIGADRNEFRSALAEVPAMPLEKFELIAKALHLIANELSVVAYQNLEQERLISEGKKSEEAIRESRTMLAAILDAVPQSIFLKDADGVFLACNQPFAAGAGLEGPERIIGKTDYDLPWAGAGDAYRADDREVMRLNRPKRHIIEPVKTADGTTIWVDTTKVPLVNGSGTPYGVLGVFDDITERKRTEAALLEGYEMLANLTAQVPGVVYQYRLYPDGRSAFPFSSRGMNDIYEYAPEDVREDATPVFGRLHPDDYDRVAADIQESARTLKPFNCEFRVILPRQGLRWRVSDALPQRLEDGSTLWYGIISDATDRVLAEDALAENRARLDLALRSASMGVWHFDLIEDTRAFDEQVCLLLGIDRATFTGSAAEFFQAVHPDDVERVKAALARTIAQSTPYEPEYRAVSRDGAERWVAARGSLVRDEHGRPTRINGVLWDITDRKHAEEELAAQSERIERTLTSVIDIARDIVEERDPYTAGHQRRVSEIAVRVAQDLGMSVPDVEDIRVAALLHDVGKVVVPTEILSKPGRVSALEFELLKSHAEAGHRVLASAHLDEPIPEMVHQHHERCDGSGYPRGLTADQILPGAKVIAVADVVEAMMSYRPYRPALGIDAALAELERGAGSLFDADVARCCVALFREGGFELS
jgi:PAS domain S-box-containing protein/putative nucleotidyltransferase with HDIG domain